MKSILLVLAAVCMAGNLSALTLTGKDLKSKVPASFFKESNGVLELTLKNSVYIAMDHFVLNEAYAADKTISFEYKLVSTKDPGIYLRMCCEVKGKKNRTWNGFTPKAKWNKVSVPFSKLAAGKEKLKDGDVLTKLLFYSSSEKRSDLVLAIRNLKIEAPVKK